MLTVRGSLAHQRLLPYSFCVSWLRNAITLAPCMLHRVTFPPVSSSAPQAGARLGMDSSPFEPHDWRHDGSGQEFPGVAEVTAFVSTVAPQLALAMGLRTQPIWALSSPGRRSPSKPRSWP
jgi:hypothetical protein